MIKEIQIGEIIRINKREFILIETQVGNSEKKRPSLILLKNAIHGIYRKPYFNRIEKEVKE